MQHYPRRNEGKNMSTRHLVDPEIAPALEMLPAFDFTPALLPVVRAQLLERRLVELESLLEPEIAQASGRDGAPDVPLYLYDAKSDRTNRPAILHIHGGGMVIGSAEMSKTSLPEIALANDVVAVSVEYRLAPETAFPGPQEDCYAALAWLVANAERLGIDPQRILVMGESAGGGLAAALAHMVLDRGEFSLSGQILFYPMLDHRTGGPDCPHNNPMTGEFVWNRNSNQFGWESLRGSYGCDDARLGWFSPARASSLAGLPPAFISVGALDLFLDEDLEYARRLTAAGVPVELHVYPGAFHGYNLATEAAVSRQSARDLAAAIARFCG
jgi:acetyl esterase